MNSYNIHDIVDVHRLDLRLEVHTKCYNSNNCTLQMCDGCFYFIVGHLSSSICAHD